MAIHRALYASLLFTAAFLSPSWSETLRLKAGDVDASLLAREGTGSLHVVQFTRPVRDADRDALEARGARVLAYLPDHAFVVRAAPDVFEGLASLSGVGARGALPAAWRLAPELGARAGVAHVTIDLWADADPEKVASELAEGGLEVRAVFSSHGLRRLLAAGHPEELERAAAHAAVAFIAPQPTLTLRNDDATWVLQSNVDGSRPIWDRGLHGQGQVIGNIDGPLDVNSCYFDDGGAAPGPGHRKLVAYRSRSGFGDDGHGTHTAGTMAGDDGTWGAPDHGDGHAFAAKISFTNVYDVDGSGSAPSNLKDALVAAHADGARVHGNSWGDDGTTAYTSWCQDIDAFTWENEDSLVVFAVTNGSNLKSPENAKNVLAVGATKKGAAADQHCSGGRGPTNDGRRKPELFAPGCSTRSATAGVGCGTRTSTGTSMACPAVSGAALLARQYFTEGWYPSGAKVPADARVPSGALLKALLVSGAVDMSAISGYPNDREGWGRVHLERSLHFAGDTRGLVVLDDPRRPAGLADAELRSYALVVEEGTEPLRVTLAFSEPPAALLASAATVNDLDLELLSPSGVLYRGNVTDGEGSSLPGGDADPRNNLEQVLLDAPEPGRWTARVVARQVVEGPQGFALLATGDTHPRFGAQLVHQSERLLDAAPLGNDDGALDPGETATLAVTLRNSGDGPATAVTARLEGADSAFLRIGRDESAFPGLGASASAESQAPHFELTLLPNAPCGQTLAFTLVADAAEISSPQRSPFTLSVGGGDACVPLTCPDAAPVDEVEELLVHREDADLVFAWNALADAAGYHVLRADAVEFGAPLLVGRSDGALSLRAPGEAGVDATLTHYLVRGTNSCHWEGP